MKLNKVKDERVVQMNNKIQAEAYGGVSVLLFISVFIKAYVLELSYTSYISEIIIILLSTAYVMIRSFLLGNDMFDNTGSTNKKKLSIKIILASSLFVTSLNAVKNYTTYSHMYSGIFDGLFLSIIAVTFISSIIFLSVIMAVLYYINKKGQDRVEATMNSDDE